MYVTDQYLSCCPKGIRLFGVFDGVFHCPVLCCGTARRPGDLPGVLLLLGVLLEHVELDLSNKGVLRGVLEEDFRGERPAERENQY